MRLLAVDLGDKRTGLATGDTDTGMAFPLEVLSIPRGPELARAVIDAARDHAAQLIVLGLPMNMDGTEGPRAKLTRDFGDVLGAHEGLTVAYQDERLTSFEADDRTRKAEGRTPGSDAVAAQVLLEEYMRR